jgi:predicted nucleic acid-binding Zn ribbon protein
MFIQLRKLILKNANRFRSQNEAVLLEINDFWENISKEMNIGRSVGPQMFKGGVLTISCSSSAEASNLNLIKERIKIEINKKLERKEIKKIQFRIVTPKT